MREPKHQDEQDAKPPIPQGILNVVSVVLVVAMILGSAWLIVELTDGQETAGVIGGLLIAALLVLLWLRMPARGPRA